MQHKLYLNGQYLKTVDFKGFPPDINWMFDLTKGTKYVRNYDWGEDLLIILFHGDGDHGLEGYYGTIDKKTEKKIRRLR